MLEWPHAATPLMVVFLFLALALDSWFFYGCLFAVIAAVAVGPALEGR